MGSCKTLKWLKLVLSLGYRIDVETGAAYRPDGSPWATSLNDKGYPSLQLTMRKYGGHFSVTLHKAVGYLIWGDAAFGGSSVHIRHLDSNKLNCTRANLAIGTAKENNLDKPAKQRSDASRKRAAVIGKEALVQIGIRSAEKRGHAGSVKIGRMSGALRRLLSASDVDLIRSNAKRPKGDRVSQRKLAASLGVTQGTVCDVLAGRCYSDTGEEAPDRLGVY